MRRPRVVSSGARLVAAGAALAVLAVMTPAAAVADGAGGEQAPAAQPSGLPDAMPGDLPGGLPGDGPVAGYGELPEGSSGDGTEPGDEPTVEAVPEPQTPAPTVTGSSSPTPTPTPARAEAEPAAAPVLRLAQYVRSGDAWQAADGKVEFGSEIRYVFTVSVPAGQALSGTVVRAYVPGWDTTGDRVTNVRARLVPGSARCSEGCQAQANENTGLVSWSLGDVEAGDEAREFTAEYVARFGPLPDDVRFDDSGLFVARAWSRGRLSWQQATRTTTESPVYSNAVTATAVAKEAIIGTPVDLPETPDAEETAGPRGHKSGDIASVLPNTGGPDPTLLLGGLALILAGGVITARSRRRTR